MRIRHKIYQHSNMERISALCIYFSWQLRPKANVINWSIWSRSEVRSKLKLLRLFFTSWCFIDLSLTPLNNLWNTKKIGIPAWYYLGLTFQGPCTKGQRSNQGQKDIMHNIYPQSTHSKKTNPLYLLLWMIEAKRQFCNTTV